MFSCFLAIWVEESVGQRHECLQNVSLKPSSGEPLIETYSIRITMRSLLHNLYSHYDYILWLPPSSHHNFTCDKMLLQIMQEVTSYLFTLSINHHHRNYFILTRHWVACSSNPGVGGIFSFLCPIFSFTLLG